MTDRSRADTIELLLAEPQFAELTTFLERGGNIGPEMGRDHDFIERRLGLFNTFYAAWGAEVSQSDAVYFLVGGPNHFGQKRLTVADMLVGQMLAESRIDARRLLRDAIPFDDFVARLKMTIGSPSEFLDLFAHGSRKLPNEQDDVAQEVVMKSLKRLQKLGFVELSEQLDGFFGVKPNAASLRFAEPARRAGGNAAGLDGAIDRLIVSGGLSTDTDIEDDGE